MSTDKLVSKSDLQEFYSRILPYLGGSADAGFTPVGTVISVMGKTAPANYLPCDGSVYNIADYKELADYFLQQFESVNYFGGDGTTTFAVPDLQGEFLRGTGTNSHTNQGNGASVGVHQDATELPMFTTVNAESSLLFPVHATGSQETKPKLINEDTITSTGDTFGTLDFKERTSGTNPVRATSRPTNTSVLFCIATKNIYLNPSMDYSTDEKVVGTYIDGKPIYQITFEMTVSVDTDKTFKEVSKDISSLNIESLVKVEGVVNNVASLPLVLWSGDTTYLVRVYRNVSLNTMVLTSNRKTNDGNTVRITIQYTKTSD